MTTDEAKTYLAENRQKGCTCPVCDTYVKVYARKLHARMAYMLIRIYKELQVTQQEYLHVQEHFLKQRENAIASEYPKLRYWGLLEEHPDEHGLWKVTYKGREFLYGNIQVSRVMNVVNNKGCSWPSGQLRIETQDGLFN